MSENSNIIVKMFHIAGLIFILSGILLNEWTLAAWISLDGIIAPTHRIIIWAVDLGLISTGLMVIKFNRLLKKEMLFAASGIMMILAGILFIGRFLPVIMDAMISKENMIFLNVIEGYFIITGLMTILYRKSADLKTIVFYCISSLIFFAMFLGYDYYLSYSELVKFRSINSEQVKNVKEHLLVKDDKLGWKLMANSKVRLSAEHGTVDLLYEIDGDGLRKINNTESKPEFSIYFFGDSFTFGDGVNNRETFPAVIKEKYLIDEVNVYNAGVNAYGTVQMFQRFMEMKDRIRPGDLVIFTPLSEDIRRNLRDFYFPYIIKFTNMMEVENYPLFDKGTTTYPEMKNNFFSKLELVAVSAHYSGSYFKFIRNKFIPDTTRESQEMMKIIKEETERNGGKFVLFFLPNTVECINRRYAVDISGFNYLDIMDFFPEGESEVRNLRLSEKNYHWNKTGHETAARAIVTTLIDEGIVTKRYLRIRPDDLY